MVQKQNTTFERRRWLLFTTEYIFYCKRAILFLSSSKILTPHPPLRECCGGRTDSPGGEGDGGSIFWKTKEIGLPSYSKICTLCCSRRCISCGKEITEILTEWGLLQSSNSERGDLDLKRENQFLSKEIWESMIDLYSIVEKSVRRLA